MDTIATPDELRAFLQDPTLDEQTAIAVLTVAAGEVRAYAGQDFTPTTDDDVVLDGTGTAVLLLPELPVLDVTLVEVGAGGAREELDGPEGTSPAWEWSEDGILRRLGAGRWPRRFRWIRVVYSHGFDPYPSELVGVVLKVAARGVDNPEGFRGETLGRYSYTSAGESAGVGLTRADERILDRAGFVIGTPRRPRATGTGSGS